ncbi:MAG: helix-turn-helix transcriptional regulator [Erysipelothrix sp.]|nr:helix-turn-helix transcriptional regulator [Erysipelothrix sp.]
MIVVRLDRVLADKKMSLKQLAEETEISEVNLSRLKNGHVRAIRFTTLNKLCEVLKCQPRDLLEFYYDI